MMGDQRPGKYLHASFICAFSFGPCLNNPASSLIGRSDARSQIYLQVCLLPYAGERARGSTYTRTLIFQM